MSHDITFRDDEEKIKKIITHIAYDAPNGRMKKAWDRALHKIAYAQFKKDLLEKNQESLTTAQIKELAEKAEHYRVVYDFKDVKLKSGDSFLTTFNSKYEELASHSLFTGFKKDLDKMETGGEKLNAIFIHARLEPNSKTAKALRAALNSPTNENVETQSPAPTHNPR